MPGEEKHFCEIDCHIAYAVLGVVDKAVNENEKNWAVNLRTRFDETTISEYRPKDATLTPDPRKVVLLDENGVEYMSAGIDPSPEQAHRFGKRFAQVKPT